MLILARRPGERVVIGDEILVTVMEVSASTVRLGIEAPRGVSIFREEIWLAVKEENKAAAEATADALPSQPVGDTTADAPPSQPAGDTNPQPKTDAPPQQASEAPAESVQDNPAKTTTEDPPKSVEES